MWLIGWLNSTGLGCHLVTGSLAEGITGQYTLRLVYRGLKCTGIYLGNHLTRANLLAFFKQKALQNAADLGMHRRAIGRCKLLMGKCAIQNSLRIRKSESMDHGRDLGSR